MDPSVGWYMSEQDGPAKRIWLGIWDTTSEMDNNTAVNNNILSVDNSKTTSSISRDTNMATTLPTTTTENNYINTIDKTPFNPARRKAATNDNKASTYNMNKCYQRLIGTYHGCPWRPPNFQYGRGIIG